MISASWFSDLFCCADLTVFCVFFGVSEYINLLDESRLGQNTFG